MFKNYYWILFLCVLPIDAGRGSKKETKAFKRGNFPQTRPGSSRDKKLSYRMLNRVLMRKERKEVKRREGMPRDNYPGLKAGCFVVAVTTFAIGAGLLAGQLAQEYKAV